MAGQSVDADAPPAIPRSLRSDVEAAYAAIRSGDLLRATQLAERAISHGYEDAQLLTLIAYRDLGAGDHEHAFAAAARACDLTPHHIDALNAAASSLEKMGRLTEALSYFERALALAPNDVEILINASVVLERDWQLQRACDLLERAFAIDPSRADAAARLAFISSNRGEMSKARRYGQAALALDPRQAYASFAVALADIDEGSYEAACARLRLLVSIPRIGRVVRATAQKITGDALHAQGRYTDAFAAYSQGGEALHALYAPFAAAAGEPALGRSKRISAYISRTPTGVCCSPAGERISPVRSHVFLVGFPRSGTTLLARALASHPQISVLDERNALFDSMVLTASDADLAKLASMSESELDRCREAYWRRVAAAGFDRTADVLVEKMPFYTEVLGVIARLFPDAKILFALRDPRDVVFSCFRRRFAFTPYTYELLTLESAAIYYDSMMALSEVYRRTLSLPFFDVRHEDVVSDFDNKMRAICEFIGVPACADFEMSGKSASQRDIATPEAARVSRGIERDSLGQWRHYSEQMQQIIPLLESWIERFGYSVN